MIQSKCRPPIQLDLFDLPLSATWRLKGVTNQKRNKATCGFVTCGLVPGRFMLGFRQAWKG